MRTIRIPPQLSDAVDEDDYAERLDWLAALPRVVDELASAWRLELGEPYLPGGQCAWVAPARDPAGRQLVLKVGWRHREAEHEADALRFWGWRRRHPLLRYRATGRHDRAAARALPAGLAAEAPAAGARAG
jgi:streptomycin 6-kinase